MRNEAGTTLFFFFPVDGQQNTTAPRLSQVATAAPWAHLP